MDAKTHWEKVYTTKAPNAVSWYRTHLEASLALIERAVDARSASIIDVGGGESTLVDDLLFRGMRTEHHRPRCHRRALSTSRRRRLGNALRSRRVGLSAISLKSSWNRTRTTSGMIALCSIFLRRKSNGLLTSGRSCAASSRAGHVIVRHVWP